MTDKHPSIIAIDGPAASGKSTLGGRLADALGYLFLDTGVMYRAVTWQVLHAGIDVEDESAVTAVAEKVAARAVRGDSTATLRAAGGEVTSTARRLEGARSRVPATG